MKKVHVVAILLLSLFVTSCGPSKDITGVWVNKDKIKGKKFHNIFVIVLTGNLEVRNHIETDLVNRIIKKGFKAVKSIDVLTPTFKDGAQPTKEEILQKVKDNGCDGIFVASLLKKEEEVRYVACTNAYSIGPYYTWSGTFFGYYSHYYPSVSTSGYYTNGKNYFVQSNLYDTASEEIMWSVQSRVFDPSSLNAFIKAYTSSLVTQLQSEGLLK